MVAAAEDVDEEENTFAADVSLYWETGDLRGIYTWTYVTMHVTK